MNQSYSRTQRRRRGGLTLVEMLVATAVTLVLVLAVTQSFAVVSQIISVNRATLEMAGRLRGATLRLQRDLDEITAPAEPWLDSESGLGYFEYVEGPGWDGAPSMFPLGVTGLPTPPLPIASHLGDVDDVLMFTAKSLKEPFVGTVWDPSLQAAVPIESESAEVVWWTVLQDNGDEVFEIGETFKLHRRALLIKPELNDPATGLLPAAWVNRYRITGQSLTDSLLPINLNLFLNENDISVRPVFGADDVVVGFSANSLNDLTFRRYRFAHYPVNTGGTQPKFVNPYQSQILYLQYRPFEVRWDFLNPTSLPNLVLWGANRGPDNAWGSKTQNEDGDSVTDNASEALWPGSDDFSGFQEGQDLILPHVLAFDVRAFDETAPLNAYPGEDGEWGLALTDDNNVGGQDDITEKGWPRSDDEVLSPGDPGWSYSNATLVGHGAYVDLYYRRYAPASVTFPPSKFSEHPFFLDADGDNIPDPNELFFRLATFDTWPHDYEHNGRSDNPPNELIDEGINGIDDNNAFGVDDLTERETQPPYEEKLRGIQIRIRIIDPDTRQVRQQTVRADFTPN